MSIFTFMSVANRVSPRYTMSFVTYNGYTTIQKRQPQLIQPPPPQGVGEAIGDVDDGLVVLVVRRECVGCGVPQAVGHEDRDPDVRGQRVGHERHVAWLLALCCLIDLRSGHGPPFVTDVHGDGPVLHIRPVLVRISNNVIVCWNGHESLHLASPFVKHDKRLDSEANGAIEISGDVVRGQANAVERSSTTAACDGKLPIEFAGMNCELQLLLVGFT